MKKDYSELYQFCSEFAKKYSKLSGGCYSSEDNKFKVKKTKFSPRNCPSRVHTQSGAVEINTNLAHLPEPALIFFTLWAFVRNECDDEIEADRETLLIMKDYYDNKNWISLVIEALDSNSLKQLERGKKLLEAI